METLGAMVGALIALAVLSVVIGAAKSLFFTISGANKPLTRIDQGRDDIGRGLLESDADITPKELTRGAFTRLSSSQCPLHDAPYLGWTRFALVRPPGVGAIHDRPVGYLSLIACAECVEQVQAARDFVWTRRNRRKHPVWASSQLYPHLVRDVTAKVAGGVTDPKQVYLAFDTPLSIDLAREWLRSPDVRVRAEGVGALRFRQSPANVLLIQPLLGDQAKADQSRLAASAAMDVLESWGLDKRKLQAEYRAQS